MENVSPKAISLLSGQTMNQSNDDTSNEHNQKNILLEIKEEITYCQQDFIFNINFKSLQYCCPVGVIISKIINSFTCSVWIQSFFFSMILWVHHRQLSDTTDSYQTSMETDVQL